jgi:signal transduction histidine kinase
VAAQGLAVMPGTIAEVDEDRWRRLERMETLGQLTACLAHDLNNMLTVITRGLDLVARDLEGAPLGELAQQVYAASCQGADLIQQLLSLAHNRPRSVCVFDVNHVVSRTLAFTRRLMQPIRIVERLTADPLPVRGDPCDLQQVVLNLLVNARDATPEDGEVIIETRSDAPWALLSVADNGAGMDEATRARAFDPFFTSKQKGTGLGLFSVRRSIALCGGSVAVASELGKGSRFDIRLPRAEAGGDGAQDAHRDCG